jgi:site-specific DNA recombinase
MVMKAVIYARVSTERQAERGTIGSQVEALRAHVAAAGAEPAGEYCDDGCSGARLDRPGLDALRDAAEAGLFEVVWCLSPDRLARSYAYQVLILDELARLGVSVRFTDAPGLDEHDPQARLLTQVQGVIAEYERAKIGERYRRGKLFRARAGEVISWKAPYGYRRIPRGADGPAHLEIFEPEAAVVRRIFAERAAGTTIRQICRLLNADAVPTPTGSRAVWGTSTLDRMLRNEAYIGRTYFNRTEAVPARKPGHHSRQVPRPRADWIAISCPAIIADDTFEAAGKVSTDNTKWSPRRAEPGAWLLRGLVKCGPCGVGTSCHKMRGRNGTWHRYYYCHNHDPLRAGGQDRRCPERNIRADALDEFVFGQVRAALLDPGLLLAGEQAIAVHAPVPDDQLLAAELARLDRKLEAARIEHRRLIDLYQAGLIDMPELQRRAAAITARQRELEHKRASLAAERADLARGNRLRHGVEDFAARVRAVIDQLDPAQRQQLLRLLIEEVQVTGWHVKIRLHIPLDDPPDGDHTHRRTPQPRPAPASSGTPPVSTEDRLRSLHGDLVAVVDEPVQEGLGDDGVGEQRVPVLGCPVRGQDQRAARPLGDELVEVVGLGGGEFAHREVVENEHGGPGELAEPLMPGVVGVAAGQVGQGAAGFEEPGVGAVADGQVPEGLGDVALADADRTVEDHRLAGVQPAQRGQVADLGSGQLRAGAEVEALEGGLLLEAGLAQPPGHGHGLAAGDLVFAQDLEELDVAEFPGAGLG